MSRISSFVIFMSLMERGYHSNVNQTIFHFMKPFHPSNNNRIGVLGLTNNDGCIMSLS